MEEDIWYYTDGENSIGPLTRERLRALYGAGVVFADTLVCRGKDAEWIPFVDHFQATEHSTAGRSPLESTRPETTPGNGSKLLTAFIFLVFVGIACLVLPIKWVSVAVWLVTPFIFAAAIIIGHLIAARSHTRFLGFPGKRAAHRSAGLLYLLLGVCSCAAALIIVNCGDARPAYLREGWRGIDISEPAAFSWALLRADLRVDLPSEPVLKPTERQAAEKLASLIAAKNKLWLMTRMKFQRASTPHQFAKALGEAANGFTTLGDSPEYNVGVFETDERVIAVMLRMTRDSNAKTAAETQVTTEALATDMQRFGYDPEVAEAMPRFVAALNPVNALSGLAATLRSLATALLSPADTEHIELARKSVEAEISNLNSSLELNPELSALLQTALDRTIDLSPSETHVNGPWGNEVTVRGEQSSAAESVATATASAVNLLSSYPAFLLTKSRATHPAPLTNAPAKEASATDTYLDGPSLRKYFGPDGFLPRLGDDLESVAHRASTRIVRCSDHNYVTASTLEALGDGLCTFTAVGTGHVVEAVVIYAPQILDNEEHDLTPLADKIRAALSPAVFIHAASTDRLEVWATPDQKLVVCVRKFPTVEAGGHTYYGSSNVVYGDAAGGRLISDNHYFTRTPTPATHDPAVSADNKPEPTPRATDGEKSMSPPQGVTEVRTAPAKSPRLAKDGTFFLLHYVSVKTARGVSGIEPGRQVHIVRMIAGKPTIVVSDGQCEFEIDPSSLTNDIDVAARLGRSDAAAQEQITTQMQNENVARAARQHQVDVIHARDVENAERERVKSSRLGTGPNPLNQ